MIDRDLIAEGREKLKAASDGPWDVDPHSHLERGCRCLSCHDTPTVTQTTNMLSCDDIPVPDGVDQERCDQAGYAYADADLIVWMRNNLPEILDRWESDTKLLRHLTDFVHEIAGLLGIRNGDDEAILPRLAALKAAGGAPDVVAG